jgi:hypothetical protein
VEVPTWTRGRRRRSGAVWTRQCTLVRRRWHGPDGSGGGQGGDNVDLAEEERCSMDPMVYTGEAATA